MAAPINSFGTPRICLPANSVNSTTTSSGTRKMRTRVSAFGRFIDGFTPFYLIGSACMIVDCHEGDPSGRGQRDAPQATHHPYAEADRADLPPAVSPLP